jgi:hypothetical protein
MHRHGVARLLLQPIDAHVGGTGLRIFGDHQAEGDDPAAVAGPWAQQGQRIEVHRLAALHHLAAGGSEVEIRPGLHHIPENGAEAHGFPQALRRPGLLQQGQLLPQRLEFLGPLHPQAPQHPFLGAQQVDRHRNRAADHVLEQQGRTTGGQHPVGDRRQLQVGVDRGRDAPQLAPLLQQREEAAQVAGGLGGKQRSR